jgi:hypothetical protein
MLEGAVGGIASMKLLDPEPVDVRALFVTDGSVGAPCVYSYSVLINKGSAFVVMRECAVDEVPG